MSLTHMTASCDSEGSYIYANTLLSLQCDAWAMFFIGNVSLHRSHSTTCTSLTRLTLSVVTLWDLLYLVMI